MADLKNMTSEEAKEAHLTLVDSIKKHDAAYYREDDPVISDAEYDKLRKQLLELEARFPELVTPDSPSQSLGVSPAKGFGKVKHKVSMLSLDNAFNNDELREFEGRIRRFLGLLARLTGCYTVLIDMTCQTGQVTEHGSAHRTGYFRVGECVQPHIDDSVRSYRLRPFQHWALIVGVRLIGCQDRSNVARG